MSASVKLTERDRDLDDFVIDVELPGGTKFAIKVPDFENEYQWVKPDKGDEFGLNLVTGGHYL